jgi:hypothetical protein
MAYQVEGSVEWLGKARAAMLPANARAPRRVNVFILSALDAILDGVKVPKCIYGILIEEMKCEIEVIYLWRKCNVYSPSVTHLGVGTQRILEGSLDAGS